MCTINNKIAKSQPFGPVEILGNNNKNLKLGVFLKNLIMILDYASDNSVKKGVLIELGIKNK